MRFDEDLGEFLVTCDGEGCEEYWHIKHQAHKDWCVDCGAAFCADECRDKHYTWDGVKGDVPVCEEGK
jgi:hypothetical protein